MAYFKNERCIHISLTEKQLEQLKPIEDKLRKESNDGRPGVALGQISFYKGKLTVSAVTYDEASKIFEALGCEQDFLGSRTF